jgi:hypothetical protein
MCKHRFEVQLLQNPPLCSSIQGAPLVSLTPAENGKNLNSEKLTPLANLPPVLLTPAPWLLNISKNCQKNLKLL